MLKFSVELCHVSPQNRASVWILSCDYSNCQLKTTQWLFSYLKQICPVATQTLIMLKFSVELCHISLQNRASVWILSCDYSNCQLKTAQWLISYLKQICPVATQTLIMLKFSVELCHISLQNRASVWILSCDYSNCQLKTAQWLFSYFKQNCPVATQTFILLKFSVELDVIYLFKIDHPFEFFHATIQTVNRKLPSSYSVT